MLRQKTVVVTGAGSGIGKACAAVHSVRTWEEVSAEEFSRVLDVNVLGSAHMAKAAAKHMKENTSAEAPPRKQPPNI